MENKERITGYRTQSLGDCYNAHARQVVENCAKRYKIVPNLVHKEKGIKKLRDSIDKMLKEVYKDYKLLDKYCHKKCRILKLSDRMIYSTDYPSCDCLSEVDVRYRYIKRTGVMESHIITPDFTCSINDINAVHCASRVTTNMRKITALLLWLRKYDVIDDVYVSKNDKAAIIISNLHTVEDETIFASTCDIIVDFYKNYKFDKRVSYSKEGRCRILGKEVILI